MAAAVWTASAPPAEAASSDKAVQLYMNGEESELSARSIDGAAYVPLDTVGKLGGEVKADADGATYTITSSGKKEIRFTVGENQRFVDGVPKADEIAAKSIDGKVHAPLSWLSELLNVKFVNDRFTSSVYVFQKQANAAELPAALPGSSVSDTPAGNPAANPAANPATPAVQQPVAPASPSEAPVVVSTGPLTLTAIAINGDALEIEATGAVTPTVFQLKSPERIVVDLPGATLERGADGSASGSVAVDPNHPYISGIRYSLFALEPSTTVRVVIDLKTPKTFRVAPGAVGTGTTLHFGDVKPIQVMIDAGHGGHDPGAISQSGKYEKDVTLPVAKKVAERLEKETLIEPVLLRNDDTYTSPAERAEEANKQGIELFISIHANTASSSSVKGTETYYWKEDSAEFANLVHQELLDAIGSADRKVKQAKFVVVRETSMPAALLELGFLTNPEDEAKLFDEKMQDRIADAIVRAVKRYYSIA
ncbi:N-acetylmuramoyl-L-alanine amidase family protein [Paenibacillus sp. TRM 82003]|nr:N-acetylmuramoyl-L-alanine amidase family protein [Paenibacillus sp. TRM 82003]